MNGYPTNTPKAKILIVDDIPDNLRLLSKILTEQGYEVSKALNGEIALKAAKLSQPDLILLDINMPQMDGYEACERLKADDQTKEIPVIFLSALNEWVDKAKAFRVGGVGYVQKPFKDKEVLIRVENQLKLIRLRSSLQNENLPLPPEEPHSTRTPQGNILIVDDSSDNLRLLSRILTEQRYEVGKALNGQMALKSAQAIPPDLILLDINMPQMNGYEVCKQLKIHEKTKRIPVIFLSALDDVFDKVAAFQVGGVDYITKPFQDEEVIARVQTHLNIQLLQKTLQKEREKFQKLGRLILLLTWNLRDE